ncbi:tyrosine-type recombinase/integrase [Macellibacteroides fermentans]|uniref:tyrosine-type recombinase/integrase n=1 Tax=Macellibacteroides fermentans TaxID=879969 RepID=UPI00406C49D2
MNLFEAKLHFLNRCRLKGLSGKSIENYDLFIDRFINQMGNMEINSLDFEIIAEYISAMYEKGLSIASISTYIRHLKVFLRFLQNEYQMDDIVSKLKEPRMPKKIVYIYTDDEIGQIFDSIENQHQWISERNKLIIALMLDSGLRLNEVIGIKTSDMNFKSNVLKVHGKGNKERIVPLGYMTRFYYSRYLSERPDYITGKNLFYGKDGQPLTRNAVRLLIQKISIELPFEFSAHKLRHNFATNYCLDEYKRNGSIDIYKLMILLGHEDIKTTRRYLHHANQIIIASSTYSHLDSVLRR